ASMNVRLPLSPQVFAILSGLIEEHTGLHYDLDERELLADRVSPRALEHGFESLLDYYYFLRYDPSADAEFKLLVDTLVVNETYFFRELAALKVIVDVFVPSIIARGRRPRLWCAACATGEEPLTLAMLLDGAGLLDSVTLLASDISGRALAHAKAGTYSRRSLRALPEGVVGRWLEPKGDAMQVARHIARAVDWQRVNLAGDELADMGQFDVIICRNVLIYFRDPTIERVIARLRSSLLPEGHLLVGASESLLRFDAGLVCEEQRGAFFYRKVGS
ncbi:MAG TPA: protein-glutamate O-methyltransferase CheR, partial [Polyangiaceae bacterium]|nr:protein-glutamate O-methyltransferase CheR [Polyangiaceae bacterium]